ncbi:MAG: SDR family NAD(P)-dependent oxidoreductase [Alphaproteobacteria bacterium]|nr:SDR family NAD(P)-dependent oxidoreductase [Alphaproteobacteria bacterium]
MLTGKTALVTGSTRGLGAAAAAAFAAAGCNVMLNGFGEAEAIERQRAALAEEHGVTVGYHGADLAKLAEVEALFAAAEGISGAVDILVNNAVIRHFSSIDAFAPADWDRAVAVNLTAPFHLTRLALPGMRKRGWGRIVNISSVLGIGARSGRVDYVTTKTALLGLTRATAAETRGDGNVTCNAICPGSVLTPNTEIKIAELAKAEGLAPDAARREYLKRRKQPGDFIAPARIAELMLFLCRDESRDMTGGAIPIDSGRSASWLEEDT